MKRSEVRSLVLAEHLELRKRLLQIDAITSHILAGHEGADHSLREKVSQLCALLERHLAVEEATLLPAIHDVDAWGPVRADHLRREHQAQRAALARLDWICTRATVVELARTAQSFGRSLLEDMRVEEQELLNPNLLRDDLVSVDQFLG